MVDFNPTKILAVIVPKKMGSTVASVIRDAGALGATIVSGYASSSVPFFALLAGASETEREMVISVVDDQKLDSICQAVRDAAANKRNKKFYGVMAVADVMSMYKHSTKFSANEEVPKMDKAAEKWDLITAIVNSGYADEVMQSARKVGAAGGTIINGRGTARPDDVKFFGITIVPEKEMLHIICRGEDTQKIMDAICATKCLQTPGSGVVYVQRLSGFEYLGKKG